MREKSRYLAFIFGVKHGRRKGRREKGYPNSVKEMGTIIVCIIGFLAFTERDIPDGLIGLATLLFTTGIAYIGGNVWQKQIYARAEQ